ncbi:MAG: DNA repair protein RecN, partial [Bdellovibrio sp.]
MLIELKVENFAIIEKLHLQFREGLNILSGETGAGKSVLLKSLGLLMGLKSQPEMIRAGAITASVEGAFDLIKRPDILEKLGNMGISNEDPVLIVKRLIQSDRSKVYLNGSLSTLSHLRELVSPLLEVGGPSEPLIEMTGQFENRDLLHTEYQLDLVDHSHSLWSQRENCREIFSQIKDLLQKKESFLRSLGNREERLDFLKFQREEIVALDLSPGDEVNLEIEIKNLRSLQKAFQILNQIEMALGDSQENSHGDSDGDSLTERLGRVKHLCSLLGDPRLAEAGLRPETSGVTELVSKAQDLIESALVRVQTEKRGIEARSEDFVSRIEELESKFSRLRKLQKKYGTSVDEITAHLLQMETEISQLETAQAHQEDLELQIGELQKKFFKLAHSLHEKRLTACTELTSKINRELEDLNMKGVQFSIELRALAEPKDSGISHLEFQIRSSSKDEARSLARFASGGELSRILLSIKRVLGSSRYPRTYLFDEVDTGVSGPTAEKVGRKLKAIAQGQQVLCVTHLPQVAAFADGH